MQVEVYPDHEDFAVRTMGMPGLGALGVTFGNVVAMDSPSGRKPGQLPLGQHHVARVEPRLRAGGHQSSRAALVYRRARGPRRDRGVARSGAIASIRDAIMAIKDKKLLADRRARPRLHPSDLSAAGDRVVFPGRPDLRLTSPKSGATTSCST